MFYILFLITPVLKALQIWFYWTLQRALFICILSFWTVSTYFFECYLWKFLQTRFAFASARNLELYWYGPNLKLFMTWEFHGLSNEENLIFKWGPPKVSVMRFFNFCFLFSVHSTWRTFHYSSLSSFKGCWGGLCFYWFLVCIYSEAVALCCPKSVWIWQFSWKLRGLTFFVL